MLFITVDIFFLNSGMCYMELFPKYCLYNKHLTFVPSKDTCSWFFCSLVEKI